MNSEINRTLNFLRHVKRKIEGATIIKKAHPHILVYQMGKVGSSTIFNALKGHYRNVSHTHSHKFALKFLQECENDDTYIICGVREPLNREISAFFESIDRKFYFDIKEARKEAHDSHEYYFGSRPEIEQATIGDLKQFFHQAMDQHLNKYVDPWFSRFATATGFNIDAVGFDRETGTSLITQGRRTLLLYRQENLRDMINGDGRPNLFKGIKFSNQNESAKKWTSDIQKEFKASLKMSRCDYLDKINRIRWINHFYTEEQLLIFAERYIL